MTDQPLEPRIEDDEELVEEPAAEESAPAPPDESYLRLAADFDNYRKRVAREQVELTSRANERLLNELLPVLDDLERALGAMEGKVEPSIRDGLSLVADRLVRILKSQGLEAIRPGSSG